MSFGKQLALNKIDQSLNMMEELKIKYKDFSREELEKVFIDLMTAYSEVLKGIKKGLR